MGGNSDTSDSFYQVFKKISWFSPSSLNIASAISLSILYSLVIVLHAFIGLAFSGCVGNFIVLLTIAKLIA
jgi:hypothetical protein